MSDFETAAEVSAYYQGHQHGAGEYMRELSRRKKAERLLTDLIAELRRSCDVDPYFDHEYCQTHRSAIEPGDEWCVELGNRHMDAADRAEGRLREVTGDE
jgi:hypothetical protein